MEKAHLLFVFCGLFNWRSAGFVRGTKEDADEIIKRFAKLDGVTHEHCKALRKIYSGPINPKTSERIYTPMPFGSEFSSVGILGQQDINIACSLFYVFRWVFGKEYDYMQFDFAEDMDRYNETLASHVNANNPNLSKFEETGGKLIMFSGSADPLMQGLQLSHLA